MNIDTLPFVGARHRRARSTTPTLIVLHSGETNEGATAAEGMAAYFASGNTIGSAHICVDNDSAVRCALDTERTNGAGGVNDIGLHLEQAGRAGQTAGEWDDAYSQAVVEHAGAVCAAWIAKYPHLRPAYLDAAALRRGDRNGITTHAQVSQVFAGNDGHWDPGPDYPIDRLLALAGAVPTVIYEEDDMGNIARFTAPHDGSEQVFCANHDGELRQRGLPRGKGWTAERVIRTGLQPGTSLDVQVGFGLPAANFIVTHEMADGSIGRTSFIPNKGYQDTFSGKAL